MCSRCQLHGHIQFRIVVTRLGPLYGSIMSIEQLVRVVGMWESFNLHLVPNQTLLAFGAGNDDTSIIMIGWPDGGPAVDVGSLVSCPSQGRLEAVDK
jgi:hypothetical protein